MIWLIIRKDFFSKRSHPFKIFLNKPVFILHESFHTVSEALMIINYRLAIIIIFTTSITLLIPTQSNVLTQILSRHIGLLTCQLILPVDTLDIINQYPSVFFSIFFTFIRIISKVQAESRQYFRFFF